MFNYLVVKSVVLFCLESNVTMKQPTWLSSIAAPSMKNKAARYQSKVPAPVWQSFLLVAKRKLGLQKSYVFAND